MNLICSAEHGVVTLNFQLYTEATTRMMTAVSNPFQAQTFALYYYVTCAVLLWFYCPSQEKSVLPTLPNEDLDNIYDSKINSSGILRRVVC